MDSTVTWYRVPRGHLMMQSARDLAAYRRASALAKRCQPRQTCVLASVPGDCEDDEAIAIAHAIARSFNRIMLKDERDLRGRDRLEVPVRTAEAILQVRPLASCGIYEDEHRAVERTVDTMAQAEVVFLFAEDPEHVHSVLTQRGAQPIAPPTEMLDANGSSVPTEPPPEEPEPQRVESAPPYELKARRGKSWIVYTASASRARGNRD